MKRTLSFMVMAFALLFTQCRKPEVKFPTPSLAEGVTVSMTVTAGPGSKTDITTAGVIKWSADDKIYVGDGTHYVGYLTITDGVGEATGKFTGDVTVTPGTHTFHFYYLGSSDYTGILASGTSATVDVDFSNQNIYEDNNHKLKNASGQHVGYGKVEGVDVEANKPVTGLQVSMKSKVAIAYFSFKDGESADPYTGAITLRGDNIRNEMVVYFNSDDFSFSGTKGDISLTNKTTHLKYAMLVPTNSTAEEILNFSGVGTGSTTLANGIEANKFYRIDGNMPIEVEMKTKFSVDKYGTTVEFAPGNLYWDGSAFKFEANQWNTDPTAVGQTGYPYVWNSSHVSHFKWSDKEHAVTPANFYSGELFCNKNFTVAGDSHTDWRTLSYDEWSYLLNTSGSSGRTDANRFAKAKVNNVRGLLIFPDGYTLPEGYTTAAGGTGMAKVNKTSEYDAPWPTEDIPTEKWTLMESSGAVFLPAAGYRDDQLVNCVGSLGGYWSSTPSEGDEDIKYSHDMGFTSGYVDTGTNRRDWGLAVRLVR